jgi:arginine utilization regulatory protein
MKGANRNRAGYLPGNIAAAARSLNVSRTTLNYKVQKYGIRFGVVHR